MVRLAGVDVKDGFVHVVGGKAVAKEHVFFAVGVVDSVAFRHSLILLSGVKRVVPLRGRMAATAAERGSVWI